MQPDINAFFDQLCSRYEWDFGALYGFGFGNVGLVVGTNPPYSVADFFVMRPKFLGAASAPISGTIASASAVITGTTTSSLAVGQIVTGVGIPTGTLIKSIDSGTQVTLSQAATASGSAFTAYNAPLLPYAVMNAYIALASASLVQARWVDMWTAAMELYVAHFCTLWLQSEGSVTSTPGAAAASGLARGITVSKSAGPVSMSLQVTPGLDSWASWNETQYGKLLATFAKSVGAGPMWLY